MGRLDEVEQAIASLSPAERAQLIQATQDDRALLTLNRKHFIRLHREIADHAGVVACTFDPDFARQAGRIDEALGSMSSLRGLLLRVNRPSST